MKKLLASVLVAAFATITHLQGQTTWFHFESSSGSLVGHGQTQTISSPTFNFVRPVISQTIDPETLSLSAIWLHIAIQDLTTFEEYNMDFQIPVVDGIWSANNSYSNFSVSDLGWNFKPGMMFSSSLANGKTKERPDYMSGSFRVSQLGWNMVTGEVTSVLASFSQYDNDLTTAGALWEKGVYSYSSLTDLSTQSFGGTSAVPEPRTYAVIFGAVAVAIAAWRRKARTSSVLSAS